MATRKATKTETPVQKLSFLQYQKEVEDTDDQKQFPVSLLGLVGEVGDIQTIMKRRLELRGRYPQFTKDMGEEIGDALWYLASLASLLGLSLERIAKRNVEKAKALHAKGEINHFDKKFPLDERFPRKFQVVFEEKPLAGGVQVKIIKNGVFIGDALSDNAVKADGYRYHDAFHLAYAAILGWSPVTRSLLRRKRKSQPNVDEIQDGARARTVEEAISIFLFNQRQKRDDYRDINSIDIGLLKTIKNLSENLEVGACTAKQWRLAIYRGYEVFRSLHKNHGGTVSLDLDKAKISYTAPRKKTSRESNSAKHRSR